MLLKILFYCFSIVLLYAAFRVITARNPITAVLHLVLCFVTTSALWMLIQAEFLALSLVVIYVGAVMVLFLFVVMMLDVSHDTIKQGFTKYMPIGLGVALIMVVEMGLVLANKGGLFATKYSEPVVIMADEAAKKYSNTAELGVHLYRNYLYAFEIAAVILLVAMIAAISLTLRKRRTNNKFMASSEQFKSKPETSLRIVKMASSKLEGRENDCDKGEEASCN